MESSARLARRALATVAAVGLGLAAVEFTCRLKFRDTAYVPGPEIRKVQRYLKADPQLGFLWKSGLRPAGSSLQIATDESGFLNSPQAIERRASGRPVEIIGLGDSFIHNAATVFPDFFWERGLLYYNMAMHRHCPPQYNAILETYALGARPRWIVYGYFENDLPEIEDFESWRRSGLDWFTYHSGTWCGPSVDVPPLVAALRTRLPGLYALTRAGRAGVKQHLRANAPAEKPNARTTRQVDSAFRYLSEAHALAQEHHIGLLIVFIPSKPSILSGETQNPAYPELLARAKRAGIAVLDLYPTFVRRDDRSSLYFQTDQHWNTKGMLLAAEQIYKVLLEHPRGQPAQRRTDGEEMVRPERFELPALRSVV